MDTKEIKKDLEAVIVTFLEIKEGNKPFFMKRKFKNEHVADAFISRLAASDRVVSNIQKKVNYTVEVI